MVRRRSSLSMRRSFDAFSSVMSFIATTAPRVLPWALRSGRPLASSVYGTRPAGAIAMAQSRTTSPLSARTSGTSSIVIRVVPSPWYSE